MNSAQVAELRHIESTIGLEEYMNAVLVLKGARKAMLLEYADYVSDPYDPEDMAYAKDQIVLRNQYIVERFPELYSLRLRSGRAFLISKHPYTKHNINTDRKLGHVLGFPCADDFDMIRNDMDRVQIEIRAYLKPGFDHDFLRLLVNMCLTEATLADSKIMATQFNHVFQADPLLKHAVQDVIAVAIIRRDFKGVGGRAENSQENVGMSNALSQELFEAVMFNNLADVQHYLAMPGIDVNHKDNRASGSRNTPLGEAAFRGFTPIVQALLAHPEINVNLRNNRGETTLYIASKKGFLPIVQALLTHPGINVNLRNNRGETALYTASEKGFPLIVQALLAHPGIDITIPDNDGGTALHWARTALIRQLILDAGAQGIALGHVAPPPPFVPIMNPMVGKVNQGVIEIPEDNRKNALTQFDIEDDDEIVRIKQNKHNFFYNLEMWMKYVNNKITNNTQIENPLTNEKVLPEQIDIFTAKIIREPEPEPESKPDNEPPAKRRKINHSRRRRKTRKVRKARKTRRLRYNH